MQHKSTAEFDVFARQYRDLHTDNIKSISGEDSAYFANFKVSLLSRYETSKPLKFLDVGCGDGLTEFFIEQSFPEFMNTGIEVSAKSVKEAQKRNLCRTTFILYDGMHIPYENETFDVVFVAGVLHHVGKQQHLPLMKEIYRVLKNKGRLYLFEHNPWNPLTRYLVRTCIFDKNARLINAITMRNTLRKAGFKQKSLRFIIFFPRKKYWRKLINFEPLLSWLPLGGQYYFRAVKD